MGKIITVKKPDVDNLCVAMRGRETIKPDGNLEYIQVLEPCIETDKTNTITTVQKDNLIIQRQRGKNPGYIYADKAPTLSANAWEQNNFAMTDSRIKQLNPSTESNGTQPYQQNRVYSTEGQAPALMNGVGGRTIKILEFDAERERIRRLTANECARLQTIPDWYKWEVSETQCYKMLGNGWTVEVIKHIFSFLPDNE